ncbi:MAG: hypothetical protein ABSC19_18925 [Syntrophorhabdales bacterium]|jgi:hypothetical protein
MPKRKKPPESEKEQYARFLETAKAVREEGAEERFEKACEKILAPKKSSK